MCVALPFPVHNKGGLFWATCSNRSGLSSYLRRDALMMRNGTYSRLKRRILFTSIQ
jgi:hypothetical protein